MFRTCKGQAVLMDFAMGFLLFVFAWLFLTTQFDIRLAEELNESDVRVMAVKADSAIDYLVKSPGIPSAWESLSITSLKKTGLAVTDRDLSQQKLTAFQDFSSNYNELRRSLGFEEYDFYFEFQGIDDFNSGIQPDANVNQVAVKRIVSYKGGVATATLKIY
ncbi:MAG: hypothetical protein ABIH20_02825 [Candidatus Diapherotrites archaeon]